MLVVGLTLCVRPGHNTLVAEILRLTYPLHCATRQGLAVTKLTAEGRCVDKSVLPPLIQDQPGNQLELIHKQ